MYFYGCTAGFVYQASLRTTLVESLGVSFGSARHGSGGAGRRRRQRAPAFLLPGGPRPRSTSPRTSGRTAEPAALVKRVPKERRSDRESDALDLRGCWRALPDQLGTDPNCLIPDEGHLRPRHARAPPDPGTRRHTPRARRSHGAGLYFERRHVCRAIAESLVDGALLKSNEAATDLTLRRLKASPSSGRGPLARRWRSPQTGRTACWWAEAAALVHAPSQGVPRLILRRSALVLETPGGTHIDQGLPQVRRMTSVASVKDDRLMEELRMFLKVLGSVTWEGPLA